MRISNICIIGAVFLIALLNVLLFIFYGSIGVNYQGLIWFVIVELIVLCVGLFIYIYRLNYFYRELERLKSIQLQSELNHRRLLLEELMDFKRETFTRESTGLFQTIRRFIRNLRHKNSPK